MRVVKGETSSRTSYTRSAKGNVSIQETAPDGKYIVLENTHRSKEEFIGEWKLKRKIDGKKEIIYTLPKDYLLRPGKHVKAGFFKILLIIINNFQYFSNNTVKIRFRYGQEVKAEYMHLLISWYSMAKILSGVEAMYKLSFTTKKEKWEYKPFIYK